MVLSHAIRILRKAPEIVFLLLMSVIFVAADLPRGYPRSYANIVAAARAEGKVVVYASTRSREVAGLIRAFHETYPFVRVDYREIETAELYDRIVYESGKRKPTGDLAWSSAINLQIKLVNDGYAQGYASPEKPNLPSWAIWKNEAWGLTAEPVVIVYNRRFIAPRDVPRNHADLEKLLRSKTAAFAGRIATYDPETSGAGYLLLSQDYLINRDLWSLIGSFGAAQARLYASSDTMLADLQSGKVTLAYNLLGSYALGLAARDPAIGTVMPADYTLVTSRIALITREARHPNAARLLLDFMLSYRGQSELARAYMTPARDDVAALPGTKPSRQIARPVRLGPSLLTNLDSIKRRRFLASWEQALQDK